MNEPEEIIDVVDENDKVLRSAPRKEVHQHPGWIHRSVSVWVFNSQGEIFMAQRKSTCKRDPLKWYAGASGHIDAGESYESAAKRELKEELGIEGELKYEFDIKAYDDIEKENFRVFSVITDEKIVIDPSEVEQGHFMSVEKLKEEIKANPDKFSRKLHPIAKRYFGL